MATAGDENMKQNEIETIGKKLQAIQKQLGKVIVCQVGVTDDQEFDILKVETAVPFDIPTNASKSDSEMKSTKHKSYIG